jgi:hypothetical protein
MLDMNKVLISTAEPMATLFIMFLVAFMLKSFLNKLLFSNKKKRR